MNGQPQAFVTGASSGIGRAISVKLASDGYQIVGTYKDETEAEDVLATQALLPDIELLRADFTNREEVERLLQRLQPRMFSAIVNNAGMFEMEHFEDFDFQIWDRIMSVNLRATLVFTNLLSKTVKHSGAVVIISSGGGYKGSFNSMSYCASKAALMNLTKSLANSLAKKQIRVNAIAPGWIDTGMSTPESFEASKLASLGRNGKPEEVADTVAFLVSDSSRFITGTIIDVDGGYTSVDYIMQREAGKI